jgi:hypothetical protein
LPNYFDLKITNFADKNPIARGIIVITGMVYFIMEIYAKKIISPIFPL